MSDTKQLALASPEQVAALTPIATTSPLSLVQQAIERGMDGAQLNSLMDFAERYQKNEAERAYNAAMAQFKAHPPRITKNRHVKFGNTEYDHATLDHVTAAITAALSAVGISHKWAVEQTDQQISVSCILTHQMGHSESTTLRSGADTSGSKNSIQAIGSAVTYLQRYTLLAATGLAATGSDDDGGATGPQPQMPEAQYVEQLDFIQAARSQDELKSVFTVAYGLAKAAGDKDAMAQFIKSKDVRKGELGK